MPKMTKLSDESRASVNAASDNHMRKDAKNALAALKAGNERYVARLSDHSELSTPPPVLTQIQDPTAIILGCSDARVPVEMVFDQKLGELFVIRVAGNIVAPSQIGSVEFAVEKFGTRLVVVLGHSHCGAVTACVEAMMYPDLYYSPNVRSIVDRIRPSVLNLQEIAAASGEKIDVSELTAKSIRANVRMSVSQLRHGSRFLEDMVSVGELLVVGAHYDLATGKVAFFD